MTPEHHRLEEARLGVAAWRRWGPYVSDRQWGTVREDYSEDGNAWDYLPHDHARSRTYRWGEDGIAGFCDERQHLCWTLALWNGADPILKERFFGLTNREGNHGEDVKELYFHLDGTPTHSWMRMLYKYPQRAFPYADLVHRNSIRTRLEPEYELWDTGVLDDDRYFDVEVELGKAGPDDLLMRVTARNRGPDAAPLHLVPQLFFRNTWSWTPTAPPPDATQGASPRKDAPARTAPAPPPAPGADGNARPALLRAADGTLVVRHPEVPGLVLHWEPARIQPASGAASAGPAPRLLFCENDTNDERLHGLPRAGRRFKDGLNDAIVGGRADAVSDGPEGTKAGIVHALTVPAGGAAVIRMRLAPPKTKSPFDAFDDLMAKRKDEADAFWASVHPPEADEEARRIQRQAGAGLLWSKQTYIYEVRRWLEGDPGLPPPPAARLKGRNHEWTNMYASGVHLMPDTWEYPWFAAWDHAFHAVAMAPLDAEFAKAQLIKLTTDRYMHPSGELPAYEWSFNDANPPVHAMAAWRVFQIDRQVNSRTDLDFLKRIFHRLLLNFTWWVNRKDLSGRNIFEGGFLGLDNIGVFDRSAALPTGGSLQQADATSWMSMFALNMLRIAIELASHEPVYQDLAVKFFEHFLQIAEAMTSFGGSGEGLWDETDGFYYDRLLSPDGTAVPLRIHSIVGLIPLFAVEVLEPEMLEKLPQFRERLEWYFKERPELAGLVSRWAIPGRGDLRLFSLLRGHRMKCLLRSMLDEGRFLSPHGVRSMSRALAADPYVFWLGERSFSVRYEPAEGQSDLFGGNSNWRGPIWFPVNFLIVESLLKFHRYYGDDFKVEYPVGSNTMVTLRDVAMELSRRLQSLFRRGPDGRRPVYGPWGKFQNDPHFRDHLLFFEYFDGDTGRGCGANHQTGWTALVANLVASHIPPE